MKNVFFKPWVGENYQSGGIFDKKILILGESHYCGGCDKCGLKFAQECEDFTTTKVIKDYLAARVCENTWEKWMNTNLKFERSLVNKETDGDESQKIWNSIAFFNFLQVALDGSRKAGSPEDYYEGQTAFLEVINELQPDLIIVWGATRMYDWLPDEGWEKGDEWVESGYKIKNGFYTLKNGFKSRIVNIYHPSVGYDWSWWHRAVIGKLCKFEI